MGVGGWVVGGGDGDYTMELGISSKCVNKRVQPQSPIGSTYHLRIYNFGRVETRPLILRGNFPSLQKPPLGERVVSNCEK